MKRVCMALIRFYQRALSARKPYPTCRFTPTCSAYAYEAFETRGFFAGFVLTVWRLLRCSPLSPGGYDPVPRTGFRTMPLRWSKYDPKPQADEPPCGDAYDGANSNAPECPPTPPDTDNDRDAEA